MLILTVNVIKMDSAHMEKYREIQRAGSQVVSPEKNADQSGYPDQTSKQLKKELKESVGFFHLVGQF